MINSFWKGITLDDFLIQGLSISSVEELSGVLLTVIAGAVIYEGLKTFRDKLFSQFLKKMKQNARSNNLPASMEFTKSSCKVQLSQSDSTNIPKSSDSEETVDISLNTKGSFTCEQSGNENGVGNSLSYKRISFNVWMDLTAATILHMLQMCVGFTLMLAVMTFNIWVLIAVTVGTGGGFFLFDILKRKII